MKTNALAQTAEQFIRACRTIGFTDMMKTVDLSRVLRKLPHLHLDDGYVLECLTPGSEGMGGVSVIYALRKGSSRPDPDVIRTLCRRLESGESGPEIQDMDPSSHITVEKCAEGLWEYHLFTEMFRFLPLWWHANYAEETYITDADAVAKIAHVTSEMRKELEDGDGCFSYEDRPYGLLRASDVKNAVALCGDEMVLPSVTMDGDTGVIAYTSWSEWGGLSRKRIVASFTEDGSVLFIGSPAMVTLVNYECGILF